VTNSNKKPHSMFTINTIKKYKIMYINTILYSYIIKKEIYTFHRKKRRKNHDFSNDSYDKNQNIILIKFNIIYILPKYYNSNL